MQTAAERLAAEVRPLRLERFRKLNARVRSEPDWDPKDVDVICSHCLNIYSEQASCEFTPICNLTTDIQVREEEDVLEQLDEDDLNQYLTLNDPIAWGKVELDWDARWYQIEPIRCTAKKKVFRMGRQIGKTEILAILALFHVVTKPDFRVVVLAPYQDQVDIIFSRIRKYIQRSVALSDPEFKVRDKMNPHEIEFYHPDGNSSMIGITAGVRTGQKGDKARGQTPSLLIIDEGDMLDDETLESILASLTGTGPIAQMVVSSTPTGRRGLFHKWCTSKRLDFKEFHYTSMVSPHWNKEMELFYRESYSENGFAHEFLAEFGEMSVGLFPHQHIEACLRDYSIINTKPDTSNKWLFCMGVDWNRKGIGVHIIITGYNFDRQVFRAMYKESVDAGEFTQARAVERIERLNEIWQPAFIYCDEGDGHFQIETLHIQGLANPGSGLHKKVKGVDFGSKTLIRDPLSGTFVKKATKPFMVDLCVRRVECHEVELPKGEDFSTGLIGQMRDFSIIRYGREGQPVYTDDKEHTLIAWMLSVYGIIMELSDVAKAVGTNMISFTKGFGEAQSSLIESYQKREIYDRMQKLEPRTRVFAIGTAGKALTHRRIDEFLGTGNQNDPAKARATRARLDRLGSGRVGHGRIGRANWSRGGNIPTVRDDWEHD